MAALIVSAPLYGLLHWQLGDVHFLIRMMFTFVAVTLIMLLLTVARPLVAPKEMPVRESIDMQSSSLVKWCAAAVIAGVVLFFVVFW